MKLVYADPPYLGQCKSYEHFHNDGGEKPWDGRCWDDANTHWILLSWLRDSADGWAYSCNPSDLYWVSNSPAVDGSRIASWTKTWHQIRPTTVQFAWEPVIFHPARKDNKRKPMVRDWLSCAVAKQTGQRGAKPDEFNDWILDLLVYEQGDEFIDLFPGSHSMDRALERFSRRLPSSSAPTPETGE
jgi:hypothetical protein